MNFLLLSMNFHLTENRFLQIRTLQTAEDKDSLAKRFRTRVIILILGGKKNEENGGSDGRN